PSSIDIFGAAPTLDGKKNPNAPAGGEIYVSASIYATLTIGGVLKLMGYIGLTAAGSKGQAYLKLTGAVSPTLNYIGTPPALRNLNVYVNTSDPSKSGVQGRVFLALSTAGSIPGVSLSGVFLLEINSFATDGPIDSFKIKTRTDDNSPGVLFFDGFDTDAQG